MERMAKKAMEDAVAEVQAGTTDSIEIHEVEISDANLAELEGLTQLTSLVLHNTKVTDEGLASLAKLENLESLRLVGSRISDEGLVHLQRMQKLQTLDIGGSGVISVVANIVPADVIAMINAFNANDKQTASAINAKLAPLVKSMFIETNPIPVKAAMGLLGMCAPDVRLPLCEMDEDNTEKLKLALQNYGLLKGQPA